MNHILHKSEGRIHWFIEYWNDETNTIEHIKVKKR